MLKTFFNHVYFEDYIPRARDIIYPVAMLAVGYKSVLNYDWMMFGITLFVLGILLALVIIFGIGWRGPIAYWEQIEKTISVMMKIKDPAIWASMGYKDIPEMITIKETSNDEHGALAQISYKKMPINPSMMNMISNQVLTSRNLDFTEEKYKDKIPNFRKVQKQLKKDGYIAPKNKKNVRGGYSWTKAGLDVVYQYADESVIRLIEKEEKQNGE